MDGSIIISIACIPVLSLLLGWGLDAVFGDPERLPHPIVYMGKWIAFWEKRLNKGKHRKCKGALMAVGSILLTYSVGRLILFLAASVGAYMPHTDTMSWIGCVPLVIIAAILIFFCLAGHTLRKEVRMVFEAVDRSIEDGRRQVARIVGRDTNELSAQEVRTAALETLAENLSDGVIAPLFWLAVLGVPGMLAYKMINTLDSMVGYHSPRYKDFGCWAAKIDDVANYIPARITALLMLLVPGQSVNNDRSLIERIKFTLHFGPKHASPNSGWPEAALASILDCQFGGSHNYFGEVFYKPHIGTNPRLLSTGDMNRSIRICFVAEVAFVLLVVLSAIFLSFAH